MLKDFSSIWDYREFISSHKSNLSESERKRLDSKLFKSAIHKLKKLDVGLASDVIASSYSPYGRPARDPSLLIRSFILMNHLGYTSLHKWCDDLRNDNVLKYLLGTYEDLCVSNHYDFIERFTCKVHSRKELVKKDYFIKPKDKLRKGEKLVVKNTMSYTSALLDKYKNGTDPDTDRMLYRLELIFNSLVVNPSLDKGYIDDNNLVLSGDGSSLHIHASVYPKKVKDGNEDEAIYRVSAPDANIGWDSDLGTYYLGYTFYNISYHNSKLGYDLPIYITLDKASKHDAPTSIEAFAQLLCLNQSIHPKYVCLDSASDAIPIYQFLHLNNIIPVIDHNKRSKKENPDNDEYINQDGIPVCKNKCTMIYHGYEATRERKKYRCPLALGKISSCPYVSECCSTPYGRTMYVKDDYDIRTKGPLSYKSSTWKEIYKNRTSTERINNRVLNDYKLHQLRVRDLAKNAFFSFIACINIHLDVWNKLEEANT